MGLAPEAFWSLTVREFWIKHRAFSRAEDRQKALMLDQVSRSVSMKQSAHIALDQAINKLRRYPIKKWLAPKSP